MAKLPETEPNQVNRIAAGTEVKGNIKTNSDIRIDGTLEGNIISAGKIVIGESGKITGEIQGKNCDIEGDLKGKITIKELLTLKRTSKIIGDIISDKLAIEPGAKFTGKCEMTTDGQQYSEEKTGTVEKSSK